MQLPYRKPGKYSQTETDYVISQKKFDQLTNTLAQLRDARPSAALEVSRLAELGDFSENVEYQLAKRKLRGINTKILYIENDLNRAIIIAPKNNTRVDVGHFVTVLFNEKKVTYQILGSKETDPSKGIISQHSPIGQAMIGKKVGDHIQILLPTGTVEYTIQKIAMKK